MELTENESTVLFPSSRWFTAEMEELRTRYRLEFGDLAIRMQDLDRVCERAPVFSGVKVLDPIYLFLA